MTTICHPRRDEQPKVGQQARDSGPGGPLPELTNQFDFVADHVVTAAFVPQPSCARHAARTTKFAEPIQADLRRSLLSVAINHVTPWRQDGDDAPHHADDGGKKARFTEESAK
jgi:hypothetical protein